MMTVKAQREELQSSQLARELEPRECELLAERMQSLDLDDGEVLVEEGADDRRLFVLVAGGLRVIETAQGGHHETVYTMKPGEIAGTSAFLEATQRLAGLKARGETRVLTLEPEAFESLLDEHPRVVFKVMKALFHARHDSLIKLYQETEQLTNYITKMHGRY